MSFISESYGHGSFNEMMGRFVFVSYVWMGGGCGTSAELSSSWYLKSKLLISNLIFLFSGDKFLISAATIMPNKSSLLGVDCNDL